MLAEINMDSLLSIQDQYLSAVATLLSAGQQQQQQQEQKQQMIGITKHNKTSISITSGRSNRKHSRPHHRVETKQHQQQHTQPTGAVITLVSSPLDLSTKRSASSSPAITEGAALADHISNLLKIIPQSTPQPLNLATSEHHQPLQAQSITSSTCSVSSPVCCSFSRPSSTNSSIYQQAKFQDQPSFSPNGLIKHETFSSDRLISSSNSAQQRPTSVGSKKSSKATKSHLCEHCGRSFSRSDMLTRHSRLHSGLKPYQCDKCHQVFSRSDHLSTHERTHTGEKPYQCRFCSYSACRRDMITRHMRTHSASSGNTNDLNLKSNASSGSNSCRLRPQSKTTKRAHSKLVSTRTFDDRLGEAQDGAVSTSV